MSDAFDSLREALDKAAETWRDIETVRERATMRSQRRRVLAAAVGVGIAVATVAPLVVWSAGRDLRTEAPIVSRTVASSQASARPGRWSWITRPGAEVGSSPLFLDGTIWVPSFDGNLYALDASSGELEWSAQAADVINTTPLRIGDVVVVGSHDGSVHAFAVHDGSEVWTFRSDGLVMSSPAAIDEGSLVVGSNDGGIYSVDARTGAVRWSYETGGAVMSSPTVVDGVIYAGSNDGFLYALDAGSGELGWRAGLGSQAGSASPVVAGATVIIGSNEGIHAFAGDGAHLWSYPTNGPVEGRAALVNGLAVMSAADGSVHAIDVSSGSLAWRFQTTGQSTAPLSVDGAVVVGSQYGLVYFLDPKSGDELGGFRIRDQLVAPPVTDGSTLVFATWSGRVGAVEVSELFGT